MASMSRPDLAPQSSPEWQAWYARYQARQSAKQQQQEPDARQVAKLVERKKQQGGYGSL
jgi:hypothetical protein